MKLISYLFPSIKNYQRIPLLPRTYSSGHGAVADPETTALLQMAAVARTPQDAARLMLRYPGKSVTEVIQLARRKRRINRMKRAWERFVRLW